MSKGACIFMSQLIVIQVCYISLYTEHPVLFALIRRRAGPGGQLVW